MSSEVYCGDVCGEQHQVAVEGFVRVRTEEQPLDPCCMRQPMGVVEWAYLPLGEIVRSRCSHTVTDRAIGLRQLTSSLSPPD